jgi:hypothetical protein
MQGLRSASIRRARVEPDRDALPVASQYGTVDAHTDSRVGDHCQVMLAAFEVWTTSVTTMLVVPYWTVRVAVDVPGSACLMSTETDDEESCLMTPVAVVSWLTPSKARVEWADVPGFQ